MAAITPITTVGLVTADRPALVSRSLESLVHHCDAYGHRPRFLVIDGSQQRAHQTATAAAVSAVVTARGHDATYVGPSEAKRFVAELTKDVGPSPVGLPGSAGANRSLLLLLTSGEHILTVDDDVVCDTWTLSGQTDGLSLMGHQQELLETAFWPSRAAALAAIRRTPADLLAAHGSLLGQSLRSLIATSRKPVDLTRGCGHLRSALAAGDSLVVRATFAGLAGDAGTYCPHRLLFSAAPLRDHLWAHRSTFMTALTSREVSRIGATRIVTHDCSCMATCMGLANNTLVPPFMPIGRNEDGLFGAMLAACDRSVVFGHVPLGIIHDSDRPSERAGTQMLSATQTRLSELIMSLGLRPSSSEVAAAPAAAMRRVGQAMGELGQMNIRDLQERVMAVTVEARGRELAQASRAADHPRCPDYWREGLNEYRRHFLRSMARPEFFLPVEFHRLGSVEAGYGALREFLQAFGFLVASWPELWQRARTLNANRRVG
jgi:hypothetical protein